MQNGVLKHRVEGANTPAIAGTVSKLTPTVADADELEVGNAVLDVDDLIKASGRD